MNGCLLVSDFGSEQINRLFRFIVTHQDIKVTPLSIGIIIKKRRRGREIYGRLMLKSEGVFKKVRGKMKVLHFQNVKENKIIIKKDNMLLFDSINKRPI
jgi:hypothetical protein